MIKGQNNLLHGLIEPLIWMGLFLGFFIGSVIIHAIGHITAALVKGVPIFDIKVGWWSGIGPAVTIPSSTPPDVLSFFRYAGGITSASVFFLSYILFWIYSLRSEAALQWGNYRWGLGLFLLLWGIFQLYNGVLEGARFQVYVTNLAPLDLALLIAIPQSLIIHICMTYFMRRRAGISWH
jgi:hypothetical protein